MRFWFHSVLNGIILIAVGAILWLSNIGIIHVSWRRDWPAILIAIGLIELIKYIVRRSTRP